MRLVTKLTLLEKVYLNPSFSLNCAVTDSTPLNHCLKFAIKNKIIDEILPLFCLTYRSEADGIKVQNISYWGRASFCTSLPVFLY